MITQLSRDEISRRLVSHLAQATAADVATLSEQTLLSDLGLDSLLLAIILRNLEVEFAIEFVDDEIGAILSASAIDEYVDTLHRALCRRQ